MKILLALSVAALAAAACATTAENDQYAQNDCKVAPVVTTGEGSRSRVSHLDQRYAEMQLATSDYRLRQLQRNPAYATNNLEQSLQDCAKK